MESWKLARHRENYHGSRTKRSLQGDSLQFHEWRVIRFIYRVEGGLSAQRKRRYSTVDIEIDCLA